MAQFLVRLLALAKGTHRGTPRWVGPSALDIDFQTDRLELTFHRRQGNESLKRASSSLRIITFPGVRLKSHQVGEKIDSIRLIRMTSLYLPKVCLTC
jgi:hypothetical protein